MDVLELLLGDLRQVLPAPWAEFLLVLVSIVCGAIVGAERERAEKPAGLRTLTLICLGSTIFTLMSIDPTLGPADRTRIAAQIVTGVGFLGAGAILHERRGVVGLTTAASIWVIAAVGIVVGAGYALAGILLSGTILATLSLLTKLQPRYLDRCTMRSLKVVYRPDHGKTRMRIQGIVDAYDIPVKLEEERVLSPDLHEIRIRHCELHRPHRAFLADLAGLSEIEEIERP